MWIEISGVSGIGTDSVSLPLRECGLKSCRLSFIVAAIFVTPLAGVWIEILFGGWDAALITVTPLAGVWIEIDNSTSEIGKLVGHSPCGSVD